MHTKSEVVKFCTKNVRNRHLWWFAQRRPLTYDKTTEDKIAFHSKELSIVTKEKYRGNLKIRYRQTDNASEVSSANRNISKTMSSRKPTKPQPMTTGARKISATSNNSAASSISTT